LVQRGTKDGRARAQAFSQHSAAKAELVFQGRRYLTEHNRGDAMKRTLTALLAAGAVAAAAIAAPTAAEARWWGGGWRGPAIFGGLAAGAIIGGALAAPYAYPYPYGYYGGYSGAGYYAPPPYPYYGGAPCVWQQVWNGYAWTRACI
jgi:hypothetical protein